MSVVFGGVAYYLMSVVFGEWLITLRVWGVVCGSGL